MASTRRLLCLVLPATLFGLPACGGAPTPADTAESERAEPLASDEAEEGFGGGEGPATTPPDPASCDDSCARRIAGADQLLAGAKKAGKAPNVELLFGRSGDAWIQAWRGCDLTVGRGADRGCQGADRLVERMLEAFQHAKRLDGVIFAYLVAQDPRWRVEDLAAAAPRELERLATEAEQQSDDKPKAPWAAQTLAAAGYARLALGEPEAATRIAQHYGQRYGRTERAEASLLAGALARYHLEHDEWQKAQSALALGRPAAQPRFVAVLWHSLRAQSLAGLGQQAQARQEIGQVLQLWQPPASGKISEAVGPSRPSPMLGREQVVAAVGAAHFLLGEQARAKARDHAVPPYRGPATVKGANEYVKATLAHWAEQRNRLVLEANEAYRQVSQIKPVPPPRWVLRAARAMGDLWAEFADAFANAPQPAHVQADEELATAWTSATREAAAPLLDKARRAFEICRKAAKNYHIDDDTSAHCAEWLTEHPAP